MTGGYYQEFFRALPPGLRIELHSGATDGLALDAVGPELGAHLDQHLRIVRGLDDCSAGLVLLQVHIFDGTHAAIRHVQAEPGYLDHLRFAILYHNRP